MARLHTHWNQPRRKRNFQDTGRAVAVNLWKIAAASLLQIENEGFETRTQMQRLEVVVELLAYLLHLFDRTACGCVSEETRAALVGAVAQKLTDLVANNYADVGVTSGCRETFVSLLNARGGEYADCSFHDDRPGFTLRRLLGDFVCRVLGEKDRQWAPDYVMDVIAPKMHTDLQRAVRPLFAAQTAVMPER